MQITTKFTPGPWVLADRYGEEALVSKSNNEAVAYAAWRGGSQCDLAFNSKADAHLIAAAPELYEALLLMADEASMADVLGYGWDVAREKARTALAKARGEA